MSLNQQAKGPINLNLTPASSPTRLRPTTSSTSLSLSKSPVPPPARKISDPVTVSPVTLPQEYDVLDRRGGATNFCPRRCILVHDGASWQME